MASRWNVSKIAVAANTNVQVAGGTAGAISTRGRQTTLKFAFDFTTTAGIVKVAPDSATLTAGNGFPIFADTDTVQAANEEFKMTSDDELWVRSAQAGDLYVKWTGQ